MTPDLVIFDCDGVLIDSEVITCAFEAQMLSEHGFQITVEEVMARFLGRSATAMQREVEEALGRPLPADFLATMDARIIDAYATRLEAIPGVATAVEAIGAPACVASSSAPNKLLCGLLHAGLVDLFYPHIHSTVLVENGKPAPDLFLHAAKAQGARPEASVVVEDSPSGVEAGRRAGMTVIGFTGGGHVGPDHAARLTEAGAHTVIDGHHALPDAVAALSP